jgi:DNA-binding NarL/FixJ family response regulator
VPHPASSDVRNVLLAGDAAAQNDMLGQILRQMGLEVLRAPSMQSVRQIVREKNDEGIDCAIISEDLEGKSGLECAAWLFQHDPNLSCIIVADSPYNDLFIKSLKLGISDVIFSQTGKEEIRRALERALYLTNYRRGSYLLTKRIQSASRTYRRLISDRRQPELKGFMPDYDKRIEIRLFSALEAGGDMGNAFALDDHRFLMLGGDVSGHDIGSGFVSAFVMGIGRGMSFKGAQSDEISQHINDFLVREWNTICPTGEIISSIGTCTVILDFEKMLLFCACNGFPRPILCDERLEIAFPGSSNPPLGWFDKPLSPAMILPLPQTGCITMYSDGLEELGKGGKKCMLAMADTMLGISPDDAPGAAILETQRDDIMVQRFSWSKGNNGNRCLIRPICHCICRGNDVDDADNIDNCQARWEKMLEISLPGLAHDRVEEILLSTREAVLNALEHGCKACSNQSCEITFACIGRYILRIRVQSQTSDKIQCAQKEPGHIPFGLKIIKGYSDSYSYDMKSNSLLLDFLLNSPI